MYATWFCVCCMDPCS